VPFLESLKSQPLAFLISDAREKSRNLLEKYLHSQGFFESPIQGIVDIGWHGNLQLSLETALTAMGRHTKVLGHYLGLFATHNSAEGGCMSAFHNEMTLLPFPSQATFLAELVLAADHGTVSGYKEEGTRVVPILKEPVNHHAISWGIREHQASIIDFALGMATGTNFYSDEFKSLCVESLGGFFRFVSKPTNAEARAFSGARLGTDQEESHWNVPIPKMGYLETATAAWFPASRPEGFWLEGAQALHPNVFLFAYLWLRSLKPRMRRNRKEQLGEKL
jgi:hypothetical protein